MKDSTDADVQARDDALRLLSFRARSVGEIDRRLRQKGHPKRVVDEVVVWLLERGYLDDHAFARQFVTERLLRRPRGPFALVQELRKRGVERSVAEEVVAGVMEEEGLTEADIARDAARRWLQRQSFGPSAYSAGGGTSPTGGPAQDPEEPGPPLEEKDRRRLYAYLQRRGFERGTVGRVVDEIAGR